MTRKYRKRSLGGFRKSMRHLREKYNYQEMADFLGLNIWYPYEFVNNDSYTASRSIRMKLGIYISSRPRRIAVHCTQPVSAWESLSKNVSDDVLMYIYIKLKDEYGEST